MINIDKHDLPFVDATTKSWFSHTASLAHCVGTPRNTPTNRSIFHSKGTPTDSFHVPPHVLNRTYNNIEATSLVVLLALRHVNGTQPDLIAYRFVEQNQEGLVCAHTIHI